MKVFKLIGVVLIVLTFTATVSAQTKVAASINERQKEIQGEYIKDVKTLSTFFLSGSIPADFPKYDNKFDKEANKKAVVIWAKKPNNNALISEKGKTKLKAYDLKQIKRNASK